MKKTLSKAAYNGMSEKQFATPFSLEYWKAAALEVKNVRTLAVCAVLIAMRVALKSVRIPLGENLSIYIGFLVNSVSGAICGPVLSLIGGAVCDILGYLIAPQGAFLPVFTLIEMFCAFLFSICLYRTKITVWRIFLSKFLVNIIGNVTLTSLAMMAVYDKGVYTYLLPRIAKNLLFLPIEVILMIILFNAVTPFLAKTGLITRPQERIKVRYSTMAIVLALLVLFSVFAYIYRANFKILFEDLYEAYKTFFKGVFGIS